MNRRTRWAAGLALAGSLAFASGALGHAVVSPPVAQAKTLQLFTLSVPTEKEGVKTTKIELTPPSSFAIDSFQPASGWRRQVAQTGSGEEATITKVTWSGGAIPTGEDAVFAFNASASDAGNQVFKVRQTYSDGSVVDWNGAESSDTPAPVVEAKSTLGGGGSSNTLSIVALILGALALVAGGAALAARSKRPLT